MSSAQQKRIYLDYHATTPCDPRVVREIVPYFSEHFGNPSSSHVYGDDASDAVTEARRLVAKSIGAFEGEIVFTRSATEANNIVLQGLSRASERGEISGSRIAVSAIEHKSVLKTAALCEEYGVEVVRLPVLDDGTVDIEAANELIDERCFLVSVQGVNNELGTLQPLEHLTETAHRYSAAFHTDAAQMLGRGGLNVQSLPVDFASLSGHKVYGPKGVGALYLRGGPDKHPVEAMYAGGGQEVGLSPGTLNVPAIVGFGRACDILMSEDEAELARLRDMRNNLEDNILKSVACAETVVPRSVRVPTTTNIHFRGINAEAIIARMRNIAVSTGSACESGAPEPSHVLRAIGLSRDEAYECLRIAVGRFSETEELDEFVERVEEVVSKIIRLSA